MKQIDKYARLFLPMVLMLAAWLFFGVFYRWHLLYFEGNQLFLWTADYARDTIGRLGGLGEYVSRFLVQFYHLWRCSRACSVLCSERRAAMHCGR